MRGVMNTKAFCAALLATTLLTGAASAAETTAHPALWPAAKSQGLVDPRTEAFVDSLLAKLTLEEKVGQMIQAVVPYRVHQRSADPERVGRTLMDDSWSICCRRSTRWATRFWTTTRPSATGISGASPRPARARAWS